jgi:CRP-like cAMP-binding protein
MECFRVVRYSANTVCFRESDRMDFIGIIASGKMEVKTQSDLAGTYVLLGVLGKGAHIGDFSILRDRPSFGTVTTLEETELLVITQDELETFMEKYPHTGVKILKGIAGVLAIRLQKAIEKVIRLS